MGKKNNNKQKNKISNKNNDFLDMSYRSNIEIDTNTEYNDEELEILIAELKKQTDKLNAIHKKLYSSNAYIDRICKRTFMDIIHAKIYSILSNIMKN